VAGACRTPARLRPASRKQIGRSLQRPPRRFSALRHPRSPGRTARAAHRRRQPARPDRHEGLALPCLSGGPARLTVSLVTAGPRAKAGPAFRTEVLLSAACSYPKSALHFSGTCAYAGGRACGGLPTIRLRRRTGRRRSPLRHQDASGRRPPTSEDGADYEGQAMCGDNFSVVPGGPRHGKLMGFASFEARACASASG